MLYLHVAYPYDIVAYIMFDPIHSFYFLSGQENAQCVIVVWKIQSDRSTKLFAANL